MIGNSKMWTGGGDPTEPARDHRENVDFFIEKEEEENVHRNGVSSPGSIVSLPHGAGYSDRGESCRVGPPSLDSHQLETVVISGSIRIELDATW